MKSSIIGLIAAVLIFACNPGQNAENEKTNLLTSVSWKTGGFKEQDSGTIKFNTDGTYIMNVLSDGFEVRGVWEWISPTEISMQDNYFSLNGMSDSFSKKPDDKTIMRIISLSDDKLTTIERHILDAEDSGFAKKFTYEAE